MSKPSKDKLFIGWLARQFEERRSDVADVCDAFAKNREIPENFTFEKRFISAKIPGTGITVEYDTLTTEIAYSTDGEHFQQCVEHEYKDE